MIDISAVQEPWFIYGMGEDVKPIIFKGDTHAHLGYWCDLQHRNGGLLTKGQGQTLQEAIDAAVQAIPL